MLLEKKIVVVNHSIERNNVVDVSVNTTVHRIRKTNRVDIDVNWGIKDQKLYVLWHNRLGHPARDVQNRVFPLTSNKITIDSCEIFCKSKQHRTSFPLSSIKASDPFELIHMDV